MPRLFINLHRLKALAKEDEALRSDQSFGGTRVRDFIQEKFGEVITSRGRFRSSWNLSVFYKQHQHDTPHLTRLDLLDMMISMKEMMNMYRIKLRFQERYSLTAAYMEICGGRMTWTSRRLSNGTLQLLMRRI